MMASIRTKRALLQIVSVKAPSIKHDRKLYMDIKQYKVGLKDAIARKDKGQIELYMESIKRQRRALRAHRPPTYVMEVTFHRYPTMRQHVELQLDRDRKEFFKMVEDDALRGVRAKMKYKPEKVVWQSMIVANRMGNDDTGYVFFDDSSILKAHVKKNMKMLLEGKTPAAPRRYVGIELEFCAPIKEEKLAVLLFQNGIHKFAQLKEDGSLRPKEKESSFELALLLEESTYKKNLKAVTKILHDIKAVAKDRRCGLHVHLDMRRRNKDLVYNNLVACQYALLSVVNPERYDNEFCRVVSNRKFPTEFTGERVERYKTINAAAYYKYRTLEVRMHEGSVSFDEISHWVDLLLKVTNYPKLLKNDILKLPLLKTRLKLKKKLYNYALERSCSWQVQNNPNARNMREDMAALAPRRNPQGLGLRLNELIRPIQAPVMRGWAVADVPVQPVGGAVAPNGFQAFMGEQVQLANMPIPENHVDMADELFEDDDGN